MQDAPVRPDENRAGGRMTAELLTGGEVGSGIQEFEGDGQAGLLLGVLLKVGVQRGADVVCRDGHGDHLLK